MTSSADTDIFGSKFANDIFKQKYSMNQQESWADTCNRVVDNVCGQYLPTEMKEEILEHMIARRFIPGGRYLYSSGRELHQVNNCFLFRAQDSREGWAKLMSSITSSLMTGGGIGIDYSAVRPEGALIRRTGGESTGPLALMQMVNEAGRHIMQGGQRRSAIWAGLQWDHQDTPKFLKIKDWPQNLRDIKANDFNFPLQMEGTNVSVIYNTDFFVALEDRKHANHKMAKQIWKDNCLQAFSTAEPGFSFNFCKDAESLRNACVPASCKILTIDGYKPIGELENSSVEVWNGEQWSDVLVINTGEKRLVKVEFSDGTELTCSTNHEFISKTGERIEAKDLQLGNVIQRSSFEPLNHSDKVLELDAYSQGFYSGDGNKDRNFSWLYNEKMVCSSKLQGELKPDSPKRMRWTHGKMYDKDMVPFDYSIQTRVAWLSGLLDADGTVNISKNSKQIQLASINKTFLDNTRLMLTTLGIACSVTKMREAGIKSMPDGYGGTKEYSCQEVYRLHIGNNDILKLKYLGLACIRLDLTGVKTVRESNRFPKVVNITTQGFEKTYCFNEPLKHQGCFNGIITGQCTEVTSEDDSDKCNLGTVWMNHCDSEEQFERVCHVATAFLLCGGLYSHVPTEEIRQVGLKNNRIGLGLGGMHEWLMQRKSPYKVTQELHKWLNAYKLESDSAAYIWANKLGVAIPKGKRAIAPTGTIGILAETTTGIEPLFCKAYKRRYLKGDKWHYQYVVDGAVKRLLAQGVELEDIQDSYDISFKERVKFQADVQNYVDMSISSTCNMPAWGSPENNEDTLKDYSKVLLKYAKRLRGFTTYPDGCRGGQPLTRVPLDEAMKDEGKVFEEHEDNCVNGVCGV